MKKKLILVDAIQDLETTSPQTIKALVQKYLDTLYGNNSVVFSINVDDANKTVELDYERESNAYDSKLSYGLYIDGNDLNYWLGGTTRCDLGFMVPYGSKYFNGSFYEDNVKESYSKSYKEKGYSKPKSMSFTADDRHFNVKLQF